MKVTIELDIDPQRYNCMPAPTEVLGVVEQILDGREPWPENVSVFCQGEGLQVVPRNNKGR